jgi:hypothetical protein
MTWAQASAFAQVFHVQGLNRFSAKINQYYFDTGPYSQFIGAAAAIHLAK